MARYIDRDKMMEDMHVEIGHWVWNPNGIGWGIGCWECSKCGCHNKNIPDNPNAVLYMYAATRFCPQCGIYMSGRLKETNKE